MTTMLKRLPFAGLIALSLLASTSDAFAKDTRHGRETAWTDLGTLPAPEDVVGYVIEPLGVTWEE
jgi:hypothetical protein